MSSPSARGCTARGTCRPGTWRRWCSARGCRNWIGSGVFPFCRSSRPTRNEHANVNAALAPLHGFRSAARRNAKITNALNAFGHNTSRFKSTGASLSRSDQLSRNRRKARRTSVQLQPGAYRGGGARGVQHPGCRITGGDAESPNNVASTFFNTLHLLPKTPGSNMGVPNLFLAPGAI